MPSSDLRYLILADGLFHPEESKTANAVIRYTPERVVGVIDASRAGQTSQQVIGFGGDIPVVASFDEGLALKPNALLIGIAPAGGQLPSRAGSSCSLAPSRTSMEIWERSATRSWATCRSWPRSRRSTASRSTILRRLRPRRSRSRTAACAWRSMRRSS